MSASAQVGMGNDILQEPMASAAAQKVRRCDEHARCRDAVTLIGYEDMDTRLRQGLPPNALGAFWRFGGRTHLGRGE